MKRLSPKGRIRNIKSAKKQNKRRLTLKQRKRLNETHETTTIQNIWNRCGYL